MQTWYWRWIHWSQLVQLKAVKLFFLKLIYFSFLLSNLLALLPIGLLLHSISSNFCACIFTWSCSTRTELVQKWSLLVRIRTLVDRISICFFEPGDLLFRSDSGQMEEDLDAVQHVQLNQIIFALEDLLEHHAQPDILLILILGIEYCDIQQRLILHRQLKCINYA